MSERLPVPGSDDGQWGTILNGFLRVSHNENGTLIPAAVRAAGAVSSTTITDIVVLTQAEYNALTPNPSILYIVV